MVTFGTVKKVIREAQGLGADFSSSAVLGHYSADKKLHTQQGCIKGYGGLDAHVPFNDFLGASVCPACFSAFVDSNGDPVEECYGDVFPQLIRHFRLIEELAASEVKNWATFCSIFNVVSDQLIIGEGYASKSIQSFYGSLLVKIGPLMQSWVPFLEKPDVRDGLEERALRRLVPDLPDPALYGAVAALHAERAAATRKDLKALHAWGIAAVNYDTLDVFTLSILYRNTVKGSKMLQAPLYLLAGLDIPFRPVAIEAPLPDSIIETIDAIYRHTTEDLKEAVELAQAV